MSTMLPCLRAPGPSGPVAAPRPTSLRRPAPRRRHRPLRPRRRRLRQLGRPRARRRRPGGRRPQHARHRPALPVPRRAGLHALHRRAGAPGSAPDRSSAVAAVAVSAPALLPGLVVLGPGAVRRAVRLRRRRPAWSTSRPTPSASRWRRASAGRSCPGCTPASASAGSAARSSAAPPSAVLGVGSHLALVAAAGLFVSAWALPAAARRRPRHRRRAAPTAVRTPTRGPTAVLVVLGRDRRLHRVRRGRAHRLGCAAAARAPGRAGHRGRRRVRRLLPAMAGGRLAGGRLLQAMGERRLLVGGAVLAAAGAVAAVTTSSLGWPWPGSCSSASAWPTSSRWRSAAPACSAAPRGIALATTVGYTGLLGGPPVIGLLAESRRPAGGRRLGRGAWRSSPPSSCSPSPASGCACRGRAPCSTGPWRRSAGGCQPVVSGFGHGTGVYVRDLQLLVPGA